MTTAELIRGFVNGQKKGTASNKRLRISQGKYLVNYNTIIAFRDDRNNRILINYDYYSVTTSKHQNRLIECSPKNLRYVTSEGGLRKYRQGEIEIEDLKNYPPVRDRENNILYG